jgi:uncharacterized protein YjbI with pentapeptide repeats
MANEEHLDLLRQGVKVWNAWRAKHLDIEPDLGGANLGGMDPSNANLIRANLFAADFSNTNLGYADLSNTDLSNTDLWLFWVCRDRP